MGKASRTKRERRDGTNQHYVPQVYLRGFLDPQAQGKEPWVWRVNVAAALAGEPTVPKNKGLGNVASKKGYYDLKSELAVDFHVEDFYSHIEGKAAPALVELQRGNCDLTREHRFELARFMGYQLTRTPRSRALSRRVELAVSDALVDQLQTDTAENRRSLEIFQALHPDSKMTFEQMSERLNVARPTPRENTDRTIAFGVQNGDRVAQDIFAMDWHWHRSETPRFFTSDQPVARLLAEGWRRDRSIDPDLPQPGVTYSFTATPRLRLIVHSVSDDIVSMVHDAEEEFIRASNLSALGTAGQDVFCHSKELAQDVIDLATRYRESINDLKARVDASVTQAAQAETAATLGQQTRGRV